MMFKDGSSMEGGGGGGVYETPAVEVSLDKPNANRRKTPEELRQAWIDNGNTLPNPEEAHGKYETIELHSWQFVKLSQIRGEKNPVSQSLKESIAVTGLLNQIDVARVTEEQLAQYIAFTNRTWGSEASIADFADQRMDDGTYHLIIAGHSRHEAIDEGEQEGLLPPMPLLAKVHPVHEVEDIIELQSAENTHSTPKQERGAMATVESYLWGIETGKWANQKEFIARYEGKNKLNLKEFKEALNFSYLPNKVRQFVLSGVMNYKGGVELGNNVDTVKEYVAWQNGYLGTDDPRLADPESEDALLQAKGVHETLMREANFLSIKKLNSTASKAYLRAWRREMDGAIAERMGKGKREPSLDVLTSVDARRQLEHYLRNTRRAIGQSLGEITQRPAAHYATIIRLNREIIGEDEEQRLIDEMETSLKKQLSSLGSVAAREDVTVADDSQESMF